MFEKCFLTAVRSSLWDGYAKFRRHSGLRSLSLAYSDRKVGRTDGGNDFQTRANFRPCVCTSEERIET